MSKRIAFDVDDQGFGLVKYDGQFREEVDRILGGLGLDMQKPRNTGWGKSPTERATFTPQSPDLDGLEDRMGEWFRDAGFELGVM